jgi:hypothetical protein
MPRYAFHGGISMSDTKHTPGWVMWLQLMALVGIPVLIMVALKIYFKVK